MDKQERKIKEGLKLLIGDLAEKTSRLIKSGNFDGALRFRDLMEDVYTLAQRTSYLSKAEASEIKRKYRT